MGTPNGDQAGAGGIFDQARAAVQTIVDRQVAARMSEAAGVISTFSNTVREIAVEVQTRQPNEPLAKLTLTTIARLDASAAYLKATKPTAAFADMQRVSGERPVTAALIAIAVGYGAARVVKVSANSGIR